MVKKSVPGLESLGERRTKAEKMFGLMDGFSKNDPISLQKDILDHVEYTVARSRFSFDDFEAFQVIVLGILSKTYKILFVMFMADLLFAGVVSQC